MASGSEVLVHDDRPPRAAATLVVLRDSPGGLEVLLTVRPKELRFMGGAVVFPGGAVAPEDSDPRWQDAAATFDAVDGEPAEVTLSYYICVLREAFEEVGLFLGAPRPAELDRTATPAGFLERCISARVALATDRLVAAGRWVTPLGAPIRFDTRFFVVAAPARWEPDPDPREVAEARWGSPRATLAALADGTIAMAPPTIEMIQRLERMSSVAEALDAFATTEGVGTEKILSLRVSPFVHVVLAPNPGVMTGPGTNTYVFGAGPSLVIDPAVDDPDYLDAVLAAAGDVAAILVTHRHPDHVGGTAALARRTGAQVRAFGPHPAGAAEVVPIEDGAVVRAGGGELVALHTPGHAPDHLCFFFESARSLFAGDNILGEGTAVIAPPEGSMSDYMASLERLRGLPLDRIYPGHFRPLDGGGAVVDGYIAHRMERESKIVAALRLQPRSLGDIVAEAYDDTPEHLHEIARFSALAHLEKLTGEGAALRSGDRWSATEVG